MHECWANDTGEKLHTQMDVLFPVGRSARKRNGGSGERGDTHENLHPLGCTLTDTVGRTFPWLSPTCRVTWRRRIPRRPLWDRIPDWSCTWLLFVEFGRICDPCQSPGAGNQISERVSLRHERYNGACCSCSLRSSSSLAHRGKEEHVAELALRFRPRGLRVFQDHHGFHHHLDLGWRARERFYLGQILLAQSVQRLKSAASRCSRAKYVKTNSIVKSAAHSSLLLGGEPCRSVLKNTLSDKRTIRALYFISSRLLDWGSVGGARAGRIL